MDTDQFKTRLRAAIGFFVAHSIVRQNHINQLFANRNHWVQSIHRALKHHTCLRPTESSKLLIWHTQDVSSLKQNGPLGNESWCRVKIRDGKRQGTLSTTRLTG